MIHAKHCPQSAIRSDLPCTCGGMNPVPPGLTVDGTPPKVTDDNPYRDVERSRSLAARAEAAALEGNDSLAHFLLQLAGEARLLAELQGRWEY